MCTQSKLVITSEPFDDIYLVPIYILKINPSNMLALVLINLEHIMGYMVLIELFYWFKLLRRDKISCFPSIVAPYPYCVGSCFLTAEVSVFHSYLLDLNHIHRLTWPMLWYFVLVLVRWAAMERHKNWISTTLVPLCIFFFSKILHNWLLCVISTPSLRR